MDDSFLVLTDDAVNVRDSWDILETPRTSHSETDDTIDTQSKVQTQHQLRVLVRQSQKPTRRSTRVKTRRAASTRDYSASREPTARDVSPGILKAYTSRPRRPVSAHMRSDQYQMPQIIPKRYRKLGLRSHDDMLQEHFDKLRTLLDDAENMSKDELRRQHVEQTRSMIADYKSLNKGAKTKGIIISRSLPESLRPKSPRSPSSSSSRGRSNKGSSYGSSRSPSPASRCSSKRVSFKKTTSEGQRYRSKSSTASSTSRERSASPEQKSSRNSSTETDEKLSRDRSPGSENEDHSSAKRSESEENDGDQIQKFSGVEKELIKRVKKKSIKSRYTYVTEEDTETDKRPTQKTMHVEQAMENTKYEHPQKFGTIEDAFGYKRSDNNLKRTHNPEIKHWLKEKEKSIKSMKKKQKEKEEKERAAKELEMQKQAERKAESEKKLRQWQAAKWKQARLLKRENIAKRKLETQDRISSSESDLRKDLTNSTPVILKQKSATIQPKAPEYPRPTSAPAIRRRIARPRQIPVEKLIATNPELKEKMKQLEKQKRLKHRQSYDEWLKLKEMEKTDTLKVMREQRKKVEKEICEETAKVISEAAKRRMDNIRYKGSENNSKDQQPTPIPEPTESEPPKQAPYTWRHGSSPTSSTHGSSGNKAQRTAPVPSHKRPQSAKTLSKKIPVEEKVTTDASTNPFTDPFKPPKLRRPKSKLEQSGVNGPEFSSFIWELVNEQEKEENRPEPQGADSPSKSAEPTAENIPEMKETLKPHPQPEPSKSPTPPTSKQSGDKSAAEPIIESGRNIFSLTSIE